MKRLPEITDFKHIAFIQTAFLGDVVLTLPLVEAVRQAHPRAEISFVTTPSSSPLISCVESVNNVITYDKRGLQSGMRGIRHVAGALIEKGVDCIISPHRSIRSALINFKAKPVYSVSFNSSSLSFLYNKRVRYIKPLHEVQRNLSLLKAFKAQEGALDKGLNESLRSIVLDIDADDKSYIESKLNWAGIAQGDRIAAIAPGSAWHTKQWKAGYFAGLIKGLAADGFRPVIIGSNQEKELCRGISVEAKAPDFSGETSIPQLIYLLMMSSLTVTNDSAPTYLAGLAGCPVVTIFGPTSPLFGFGPLGEHDQAVYNKLKCSPCAIHVGRKCPVGTHECMISISPELVMDACRRSVNSEV